MRAYTFLGCTAVFGAALALGGCGSKVFVEQTGGSGGSGGDVTTSAGGTGGATTSSVTTGGGCQSSGECLAWADQCNDGVCNNGSCMSIPKDSPCNDGNPCSVDDSCIGGKCVGDVTGECPVPKDECSVAQCVEGSGCVLLVVADGSVCDDKNACTSSSTCKMGVCEGGAGVDCSALNGPCSVGTCFAGMGCVASPINEGSPCEDGQFCTAGDICTQGTCKSGASLPCAGGPCTVGFCDEALNTCSTSPVADGTACDDGNTCTTGSTCQAGSCTNGAPTNEGAMCNDGLSCTSGDSCKMGMCSGSLGATVAFIDDFSSPNKGWKLGPEWQIGPTSVSPMGAFFPDPAQDHSLTADNGVAGVVLGGNASTQLHPFYYLESPAVNVSNLPTVILSFYRWLNCDYAPFMHNTIDVFNGSQWINLWSEMGMPVSDKEWTFQQFDLTQYKNANLKVRFGVDVASNGAFTVSSWNIDDLVIAAAACQ